MLKFEIGFELKLTEFGIVKLLELESVTKEFLIEEFLIELLKGEERDISLIEEDSLNLLNN